LRRGPKTSQKPKGRYEHYDPKDKKIDCLYVVLLWKSKGKGVVEGRGRGTP